MKYSKSRTDKTQQLAKCRATEREEIQDTQHRLLCWVTEWMRRQEAVWREGGLGPGPGSKAAVKLQSCPWLPVCADEAGDMETLGVQVLAEGEG